MEVVTPSIEETSRQKRSVRCTINTTGSSNDSQAHYFVIADGIIAVEGDGRLNGMQKALHTFLLAADPAAADAELTRL